MPEDYFKSAITNFSQDAANGGAIRHLWNRGYSIREIMGQLDFPATFVKYRGDLPHKAGAYDGPEGDLCEGI